MKKTLITTLLAAATVASSFAQGEIGFNQNSAANAITINGVKMFGSAGTYDFGLYLGSAGTASIAQMQLVALATSPNVAASTTFNAGLFSYPGGTVTSPGNVANTIGFAAGTQYAFFVAGWAAAGGSNYSSAVGAGVASGLSALGFITPVSSPTPVPNVFGTAAGQIGGFNLTAGPEPATIAIGGLGAAALLMFRRRRK